MFPGAFRDCVKRLTVISTVIKLFVVIFLMKVSYRVGLVCLPKVLQSQLQFQS